ncbi:ABC transporter ATP-binding protein [Spirulina sp. CS-785/01]|uniref:ABC transporter ATP-binding protein n=1 Tax=Spirulina sp. CS-785/01 TaxID=3021716 RepID=UPI00232EC274|nr:ABC transporter ATP-binding protein [Spirulina sp. CS-785/01]MDB9312699.1 ABC transporter ATP-binding protein [Spirulina sp. CS-785/01]
MAQVLLEKIYKSFPSRQSEKSPSDQQGVVVLRGIDLTVRDGEFMVLVGPSGCGKSTLLRTIAGLEDLTGGNIYVKERRINNLPPKQRDIAMVFQSYALYPHLSVYDNIAFGLRRMQTTTDQVETKTWETWGKRALVGMTRSLPRGLQYISSEEEKIAERVQEVAQLLQLEGLLNRLPKQLSGGQKQRVALGRAIARNPQVFLMDEPLSNLDAKLRTETRSQIVKLQRKLGITTIYVTHDQTEAMTMGDRIAVMNQGEIQQIARPLELYNNPANRFVAQFIGSPPMNFLEVQVTSPVLITHPQFRFTLPEHWENVLKPYDGRSLLLGIRPEHLQISPPATKNISVQVDLVEALGNDTYLTVHLTHDPRITLQVRTFSDYRVRVGEEIWLSLIPEKIHLFHPHTERNIWQPSAINN